MYVFSVWSPSLQTKMGYTDKQINFIGTCANWGVYLGFIPGVFYDLTGPRWTCLLVREPPDLLVAVFDLSVRESRSLARCKQHKRNHIDEDNAMVRAAAASHGWMILQGAVLYFAGYFSFYLGATATSPTNYLIMGGLMFVAGNGSAATYISALGTRVVSSRRSAAP